MKNKEKLYIRELQLQVANERIKELEQDRDGFDETVGNLVQQIASKNILLDHFEQTIRECESACIDLQERADKAEQIIGRMVVDQE